MKKSLKQDSKKGYLALIRHGESEWNAKGLWTGWTDIGLSNKGRSESRDAAKALKHISFDITYASDLRRAYDSLAIIKEELGITYVPTKKEAALKERHYGEFTGKNKSEIKKKVGEVAFKRIRRGWDVPIAKGETLKDVYIRVVAYFKENILPELKTGKNVLIVTHGNTIRALMKYLEKISDELIADVELATGEIVIYQFNMNGTVIKKEKVPMPFAKNE